MNAEVPIEVDPHPALDAAAFVATLPAPLGEMPSPGWLTALLAADAGAPFAPDDDVRSAVRDLLRHGGYKPTGRGKPASEYLVRAAGEGALRSINTAVDACNVVSLHSGLPISVVDLDRARPPFRIALAPPGTTYLFNPAGQEIRVDGLLCLHDADGPCANAVKDAQRTKTDGTTTRTLVVVWGTRTLPGRCAMAFEWYRDLLTRLGFAIDVRIVPLVP
jgi:DNA/RNA-binding domain of Phe-tRNA-synthetase-like protein